jgi:hypothetical protein
LPTANQMLQAIVLSQWLSNFYRPIYLFRYDSGRKEIFIVAGERENIEITIYSDGKWRYEVVET